MNNSFDKQVFHFLIIPYMKVFFNALFGELLVIPTLAWLPCCPCVVAQLRRAKWVRKLPLLLLLLLSTAMTG